VIFGRASRDPSYETTTANNGSVAVRGNIENSTIEVINGMPPQQVVALVCGLNSPDQSARSEALELLRALVPKDAAIQADAMATFFRILREAHVPTDQLRERLTEIATRHQEMTSRLAAIEVADPLVQKLIDDARAEVQVGHYEAAEKLLSQAENAELAAAERATELATRALFAADARKSAAAERRAERAALAIVQLRYREAAQHYAEAANISVDAQAVWAYQLERASALCDLGREFGEKAALGEAVALFHEEVLPLARCDANRAASLLGLGNSLKNLGEREQGEDSLLAAERAYRECAETYRALGNPRAAADAMTGVGNSLLALGARETGTIRLEQAVGAYRAAMLEPIREDAPLQWAATQNNLGTALLALGERETGTAQLEEAVAAFRSALAVWTRESKALDWAMAQNNLGNALATLGERESSVTLLESAVAAYRAALAERRRERVPLDWATTQNNLGLALRTLGERESGTARLQEAFENYHAALEEYTPERVPYRWAYTQENLGNLCVTMFEKSGDGSHLDSAEHHASAALEVYREMNATYDIETAEALLKRITERRAGGGAQASE
jgi:tetratricopeptide (TPR) repeat protein